MTTRIQYCIAIDNYILLKEYGWTTNKEYLEDAIESFIDNGVDKDRVYLIRREVMFNDVV